MTSHTCSRLNAQKSKPDHRSTLGAQGEQIALNYLEESGYLLEAQNWSGTRGELDLIMRRDQLLVIVEVRTTSTPWLDRPAEATPISKQRQVARCADEYCSHRLSHAPHILDIRFDVIGILIKANLSQEPYLIDHVENAYYSPFAF